jgi:malate permease and related proteins
VRKSYTPLSNANDYRPSCPLRQPAFNLPSALKVTVYFAWCNMIKNMPFSEILNVILPTFITILIGYVIGKIIKIDMSGVVDVVFYIGLPALAFVSISSKEIVFLDAVKIWASALMVTVGCAAIAWVIFKLLKKRHSGLYLPISLPNTVNIPFPIISLAYGSAGLFSATLYYIPGVIMIYSAGIFIAAGKGWQQNLKTMLKVPTLYAAIAALLLNYFHVGMPVLVVKPLEFIGSMVTPAVVLTLGYSLSHIKITAFPTTLMASLIRMGGGLALGFLAIYIFGITGIARSVIVLMSSMPSAVNTYLIAAKYKNEPELVASVVLITCLFSLILIPFLLYMLG